MNSKEIIGLVVFVLLVIIVGMTCVDIFKEKSNVAKDPSYVESNPCTLELSAEYGGTRNLW